MLRTSSAKAAKSTVRSANRTIQRLKAENQCAAERRTPHLKLLIKRTAAFMFRTMGLFSTIRDATVMFRVLLVLLAISANCFRNADPTPSLAARP
jgi:hypothetical protein